MDSILTFTGLKTRGKITTELATTEAKVEKTKYIKTSKPIETKTTSYFVGHSLLINIGAIIELIIFWAFTLSWIELLKVIGTFNSGLKLIGSIVVFVLIITSMRMPKIISGYLEKTDYRHFIK